ncbi:MAG: tyrosine-type recombinase/integrase [Phycisphaerales bacterium]|nr:tyrosine-type recombinase/integrase [Phycisphaerales bacterium]
MSFDVNNYSFSLGQHKGQQVIWIHFPKIQNLIDEAKKLVGIHWSASQKCWYVLDKTAYRLQFNLVPKEIGNEQLLSITSETNKAAFRKFQEQMKLKAYNLNTIKTYSKEFAHLLQILKEHPVDELSLERLRAYFVYCIVTLKIKANTLHSRINAIKFYFEQVLHREKFFFDIPRPQKPSLLPKVISAKDIVKMIQVVDNPKHKLILCLCYGMGLRVSEIINLKISNIDSDRMQVHIEASKNKKDRYVNLPNNILEPLRSYCKQYLPKYYLFEGQYGGQYSVRSAQAIFKNAMNKAKINKRVGIHVLRYSYATHLLEYGIDITFIQQLLGHNDITTTLIYTQVSTKQLSNIKSPLDYL